MPLSISTSNSASFLGIISTALDFISSSCKYDAILSAETFACASTESKLGRVKIGSWSIRKVANADKTLPAVRGIPINIQVPKVITDRNVGAAQKMKAENACSLSNFHNKPYSEFRNACNLWRNIA